MNFTSVQPYGAISGGIPVYKGTFHLVIITQSEKMAKTKNTKKFFGMRLTPFRKQEAEPKNLPKAPTLDLPEREVVDTIVISDSESEEEIILISDSEEEENSTDMYECDPPSDVELPGENEEDEDEKERQAVLQRTFSPSCCPSEGAFPPKCEKIRLWSYEERLCKHCGRAFSDSQHARAHEAIEHGGNCQCGSYKYHSFRDYHSHVPNCSFTPVFNCPYDHCGQAFRSIYDQLHHMTECDESEHPIRRKRFMFMGRAVSRIPDWYVQDSDEETDSSDEE